MTDNQGQNPSEEQEQISGEIRPNQIQENSQPNQTSDQEGPLPPWVTAGQQETGVVPQEPESQDVSVKDQPDEVSPSAKAPAQSSFEERESEDQPEETTPSIKEVKEPIFKKLIPLVGIIVVVVLLFLLVTKVILPLIKNRSGGGEGGGGRQANLTYWGLWEPESVMSSLIADYQQENPNITINYQRQSYKDYRERLQSALAGEEGPDIFRFHNTWLPMLQKDLAAAPQNIAQQINLQANFFPVISENLTANGNVYGVPIGFDSLALFYNVNIFNTAGKTPPTTWDDLRRTALDLTVKDSAGRIQVAGVALGTASNVDHFSDILGLMMLQNSADLTDPIGSLAEDALRFYTIFATQDKVWDRNLPASTYAFATEKAAMFFAPSWRVEEIRNINPNLQFQTAPVPQLPDTKVAWATYWAEGVSAKSQNNAEAWKFLEYLSSSETLAKFYTNASQVRNFGEPYPRTDLASQLTSDPVMGAFVSQGPYAKSFYMCSRTHDNGINDKIIKYYEDAINTVLQNNNVTQALTTASQGISQVLTQYGIK
jgi:multiple sugar transport system substrate-binding protein